MAISDNQRITPSGNQYLDNDQAGKLWNHVRYLEGKEEEAQDIRDDVAERKKLAKADGFDPNIIGAILKRRKLGAGQTREADNLVQMYEEAIAEAGALPREETKGPGADRRTAEEIDRHFGRDDEGDEASRLG